MNFAHEFKMRSVNTCLGDLTTFKKDFGQAIAKGQDSMAELEEIAVKDQRARKLSEVVRTSHSTCFPRAPEDSAAMLGR